MPELERTKEGEEVDAGGEVNREPGMGSAEKDGSLEPAAGGRRVGLGWGEVQERLLENDSPPLFCQNRDEQ